MAKLKLDDEGRRKLEDDLTGVATQLSGQRTILGDRIIRVTVKSGLKIRRRKYDDKDEFDRIVQGHEVFQEFCKVIGLEI